jgi:histidine triad (HIT) family protein
MTADQDCIFCKIAAGELDTEFLHETDRVVAFNDMAPLASYHILVVPKAHIPSIDAVTREDDDLLGEMIAVVRAVAETRGLKQSGYRLVTNFGHDAGQTVNHLHFHVLGGNSLGKMA